jgi:endonuclease/exonuclease/phosphatase family metal-dependent hydrolase
VSFRSLPRRLISFTPARLVLVAGAFAAATACARPYATAVNHDHTEASDSGPSAVSWLGPEFSADVANLVRWRRAVGPALISTAAGAAPVADRLIVVNWNVHVGAGDVSRLYGDIRREAGAEVPIVFLLQEAYRGGLDVSGRFERSVRFAAPIRVLRRDGGREHVAATAAALGLHAYYVPSMRNGGAASDEDRGNAILSTAPLTALSAIELPFESQRRVAVVATVSGSTPDGTPWRLRAVSAHLDNVAGARRLWIAGSERARTRQARGLLSALGQDEGPLVLGADLNSWFGFRDTAYVQTARAFPQTRVTDRRSTFRGLLRLDHLFFRLEDGWTATFRRADHSYGSDHHPLIGTIAFSSAR